MNYSKPGNYQTPTRRKFLKGAVATVVTVATGITTLADLVFAQSYEIAPESDLEPGNKKHSGKYVLLKRSSNLFYSPPGQKGIAVFATEKAAEEEERLLEEESALEEALANRTPPSDKTSQQKLNQLRKKDYWSIHQIQ